MNFVIAFTFATVLRTIEAGTADEPIVMTTEQLAELGLDDGDIAYWQRRGALIREADWRAQRTHEAIAAPVDPDPPAAAPEPFETAASDT